MSKRLFLTGIAALFLATGAAHATADGCAVVLRTPDGFLSLREAPSMKAKIIARLKPGEIIDVTDLSCPGFSDCDNKGGWTHVSGVPRLNGTNGWVGTRFIVSVACEHLEYRGEGRNP
jgi:hypothetical protein